MEKYAAQEKILNGPTLVIAIVLVGPAADARRTMPTDPSLLVLCANRHNLPVETTNDSQKLFAHV